MISVSIVDNATPAIRDAMARASGPEVKQIAGRAGANVFKSWFRERNSSHPNALGGKRTNFWSKAAAAVNFQEASSGVDVFSAMAGVLYQRFGGDLVPSGRISAATGRPITHLAIHARAEAHGKLPSEFNDLVPMIRRRGSRTTVVALMQAAQQRVFFYKETKKALRGQYRKFSGAGEISGGGVFFWLVDRVSKGPDATVFPPDDLIRDAVQLRLLNFIVRKGSRG